MASDNDKDTTSALIATLNSTKDQMEDEIEDDELRTMVINALESLSDHLEDWQYNNFQDD